MKELQILIPPHTIRVVVIEVLITYLDNICGMSPQSGLLLISFLCFRKKNMPSPRDQKSLAVIRQWCQQLSSNTWSRKFPIFVNESTCVLGNVFKVQLSHPTADIWRLSSPVWQSHFSSIPEKSNVWLVVSCLP